MLPSFFQRSTISEVERSILNALFVRVTQPVITQTHQSPAGATYAISTFGHGPHTCPGQRFAILLAKTIVSRLFEGAELSVKDRNIKVKF